MESSPVISNKVVEYRERNLTESLQIIQRSEILSCTLSSSAQPKLDFCVQLTLYVLAHCPAGRSNDNPVLVSWQGKPDSDEKFLMMPFTLTRFPGSLEEAFSKLQTITFVIK